MPLIPKAEPPYYDIDETLPTPPINSGVKTFAAIISQTSTSAPTMTIIHNALTGTPTWTYISAGKYHLTLTGEWTTNKTVVLVSQYYWSAASTIISTDVIEFVSGKQAGGLEDGLITNVGIEILVYP